MSSKELEWSSIYQSITLTGRTIRATSGILEVACVLRDVKVSFGISDLESGRGSGVEGFPEDSSFTTGKDGVGATTRGRGPARLEKSVSAAVHLGVLYICSNNAIATRCRAGFGT